jgi:hypothetical protein
MASNEDARDRTPASHWLIPPPALSELSSGIPSLSSASSSPEFHDVLEQIASSLERGVKKPGPVSNLKCQVMEIGKCKNYIKCKGVST